MKNQFDIDRILKKGHIANELDYDRALIADRKLRLLSKGNLHFKKLRTNLRSIIEKYEASVWSDVDKVDADKLQESEQTEALALEERLFIENRKQAIRKKLKELDLTQENLGHILGHKSKTYMSELINGVKPFTLKDLIVINRLFKIEMDILIPAFLSHEDRSKIMDAVKKLNKPKVRLKKDNLALL